MQDPIPLVRPTPVISSGSVCRVGEVGSLFFLGEGTLEKSWYPWHNFP